MLLVALAVLTATDSGVAIATVADAPDPHVCISARAGNAAAWTMHWTATTPVPVQLIALYAAVNDNPAAALAAAAAALGLPPPTGLDAREFQRHPRNPASACSPTQTSTHLP
jgi:hypothetical protein